MSRQYKVVFEKDSPLYKRYGKEMFGTVSRIEAQDRLFYFVCDHQPGMIGKDGIKIDFKDCVGVYPEDSSGSGMFEKQSELERWLDWYIQR